MDKPRIFIGSSGKQAKLLQALTRGLQDVAHVDPWTTSLTPGTSTLDRLVELAHQVDFAAFVFARDDWTTVSPAAAPSADTGQESPRDNVVFEAGLFGGVLGMRRTFILHAHGSKLPTDLLGLICIRYGDAAVPAEMKLLNQKLRQAIESEGRVVRIDGLWWQFSLTARGPREPSAVSLLRIARDREGLLEVSGRSWQEDGGLSARYWSEATKEKREPAGVFYYWKGERPRDPNAPRLEGIGEIRLESRSRIRVLDHSVQQRSGAECAHGRGVLAGRAGRHGRDGRPRRSETRRADYRAAGALEGALQRLGRLSRPDASRLPTRRRHTRSGPAHWRTGASRCG